MSRYRYNRKLRSRAAELLRNVEGMLDSERSCFVAFDAAKDAEVRDAIRLYVQSWIIPSARAICRELTSERVDKKGTCK